MTDEKFLHKTKRGFLVSIGDLRTLDPLKKMILIFLIFFVIASGKSFYTDYQVAQKRKEDLILNSQSPAVPTL